MRGIFGERYCQKGFCVLQKLAVKFGCACTVDDHSGRVCCAYELKITVSRNGIFPKCKGNSVNSRYLVDLLSMNWGQLKDPFYYLSFAGSAVTSRPHTQDITRSNSLLSLNSPKIFLENSIVLIQPTAKHYFVQTSELVQASGMTTAKDNRKFCLNSVRILNEESAHSKRTKPLSVNCKHAEYELLLQRDL